MTKSGKKLVGQGPGQDFVFCYGFGLKLSLLFQAGPMFLSLVRAGPGPENSSPCRPVLQDVKVEEKKDNHPSVPEQS